MNLKSNLSLFPVFSKMMDRQIKGRRKEEKKAGFVKRI